MADNVKSEKFDIDKLYPKMKPEKEAGEMIVQLSVEAEEDNTPTVPSENAIDIQGNLNKTGLMDIPEGTSLKDIIEKYCGGFKDGKTFKAAQVGTAPGGYRIISDINYPLDFDALKKQRTLIRTRALIFLDNDDSVVETLAGRVKYSVDNEICGKCFPCREGTMRMDEILDDLLAGKATIEQLDILQELGQAVVDTGLCLIGKTAVVPTLDCLRDFKDEFTALIKEEN